MANVLIESQTMTDIADAIREKNGTDNTYFPSEMPQAVRDIQSEGLDNYFNTGPYIKVASFDGAVLPETFTFDFTKNNNSLSFQNVFRGTSKVLKTIIIKGNTSRISTYINCFRNRAGIEKIMVFDENGNESGFDVSSSKSLSDMFLNCKSIIYVRFVERCIHLNLSLAESPLLSDESIQSIINGLADLTGQTAQTLTLHALVKEKLTDEQIAQITSKNWTLA